MKKTPLKDICILNEPKKGEIHPNENKFFQFNTKFEKSVITYIKAMPGPDKIALYGSTKNLYPDIKEHQYKNNSKSNFQFHQHLPEIYNDFEPFSLDKENNLVYAENPKIFMKKEIDDKSIVLKIETEHSISNDGRLYINLVNLTNEKVEFTIFGKEIPEYELLPEKLIKEYKIFKEIFENIEGNVVSQKERSQKKLTGNSEFTYGEIEFPHFLSLLNFASIQPGAVFWDLGCGAGKAMICAALSECKFSKICGVELLDGLYSLSSQAIERFKSKIIPNHTMEFKLIHGDMTTTDWSDADVIYTSSICFPEILLNKISELGSKLKKGTKILTLKNFPHQTLYKVLANIRVRMTWGKNGVYILEKV